MIRCHNCGTDNADMAHYCDECGTRLAVSPVGRVLAAAPPEENAGGPIRPDVVSTPRPPKTLASAERARPVSPELVQPVNQPVTGAAPTAQAKLVVVRGGRRGHEFHLTGSEWLIGRWDPDHGIFPDVDLDAHDPEANVSRRHARLSLQNGQYVMEDLGSTNGTFINRGRRLTPGLRYLVQDGDEVIIGKTFLKFVIG